MKNWLWFLFFLVVVGLIEVILVLQLQELEAQRANLVNERQWLVEERTKVNQTAYWLHAADSSQWLLIEDSLVSFISKISTDPYQNRLGKMDLHDSVLSPEVTVNLKTGLANFNSDGIFSIKEQLRFMADLLVAFGEKQLQLNSELDQRISIFETRIERVFYGLLIWPGIATLFLGFMAYCGLFKRAVNQNRKIALLEERLNLAHGLIRMEQQDKKSAVEVANAQRERLTVLESNLIELERQKAQFTRRQHRFYELVETDLLIQITRMRDELLSISRDETNALSFKSHNRLTQLKERMDLLEEQLSNAKLAFYVTDGKEHYEVVNMHLVFSEVLSSRENRDKSRIQLKGNLPTLKTSERAFTAFVKNLIQFLDDLSVQGSIEIHCTNRSISDEIKVFIPVVPNSLQQRVAASLNYVFADTIIQRIRGELDLQTDRDGYTVLLIRWPEQA